MKRKSKKTFSFENLKNIFVIGMLSMVFGIGSYYYFIILGYSVYDSLCFSFLINGLFGVFVYTNMHRNNQEEI